MNLSINVLVGFNNISEAGSAKYCCNMLTQSISNSLLKEFARRKSEVDFIEAERLNHQRSGIKRESGSPLYACNESELDGPAPKLIRTNDFGYKHIKSEAPSDTMPTDAVKAHSSILTPPSDVLARNYSDIMRSLAAKYNSNSPEERIKYFSDEPAPVPNYQPLKSKVTPSMFESSAPVDPTAINPISLFTGLSLTSGIIPHILDMSSTQALITLVS